MYYVIAYCILGTHKPSQEVGSGRSFHHNHLSEHNQMSSQSIANLLITYPGTVINEDSVAH